jgi:hypothetical protein
MPNAMFRLSPVASCPPRKERHGLQEGESNRHARTRLNGRHRYTMQMNCQQQQHPFPGPYMPFFPQVHLGSAASWLIITLAVLSYCAAHQHLDRQGRRWIVRPLAVPSAIHRSRIFSPLFRATLTRLFGRVGRTDSPRFQKWVRHVRRD